MRRTTLLAVAGAALAVGTLPNNAFAFGGGNGGSSGEGDGYLRQEMQNPSYVEPSRYAYRNGYRHNDPGAEYEAYRRGYPIYGPWGWKNRY